MSLAVALAATSVCATAAVADTGPVRQGVEGPETIAEAQRVIEALPWEFSYSHPPRDARHTLIIRTTDAHERTFRFFLFQGDAPEDIGIPSYHPKSLSFTALGESFVMVMNEASQIRPETDRLPPRSYQGDSGITKAMEDEYFDILFAVEDAVCELSTGKPCPAI